jgi:hypothetical protein
MYLKINDFSIPFSLESTQNYALQINLQFIKIIKMKNRIVVGCSILLHCFVNENLTAQSNENSTINIVSTAVPFLRISPDVRGGGMGETGVATIADAASAYYNLAKTPFNKKLSGINLNYSPWLKKYGLNDVYLASLTGFYKLDEMQAISGTLRYFNLGNIEFVSGTGVPLGNTNSNEFAVDFGYSRKLSNKTSIGIALCYIHSNLLGANKQQNNTYNAGNSVAGNISFFHTGQNEKGQGWNFGASITNLGAKISYTNNAGAKEYLPANLAIGTSYTKVLDDESKISFSFDINKLMVPTLPLDENSNIPNLEALDDYHNKSVVSSWFSSFADAQGGFTEELKECQFSSGFEYLYNNRFALRGGYFYEDKTKGNRKYFSIGAGLTYNLASINFSYIIPANNDIQVNPLSNTMRFGLEFNFK